MRLITAHRVLIGAAMAFFVLYALLQLRQYLARGAVASLLQVAVAVGVALGLLVYYRSLRGWGRW